MGAFDFFKEDWSLKQVAKNATYAYAQLRKMFPKLPEQQARFMALFVNSWSIKEKMPEDLLRFMVSVWKNKEWRFLCFEYAARYANVLSGGPADGPGVIERWLDYVDKACDAAGAAMRDVENGSTKSRKMWMEMPPEVFFQLIEKSLPGYRSSEAAEIMLKAIEPDI